MNFSRYYREAFDPNIIDISILFDPNINFLIGKNNLGKTNILELIHCFFTVGKFPKDDFQNKLQPIEISVVVKYSDAEIGFLRITLM